MILLNCITKAESIWTTQELSIYHSMYLPFSYIPDLSVSTNSLLHWEYHSFLLTINKSQGENLKICTIGFAWKRHIIVHASQQLLSRFFMIPEGIQLSYEWEQHKGWCIFRCIRIFRVQIKCTYYKNFKNTKTFEKRINNLSNEKAWYKKARMFLLLTNVRHLLISSLASSPFSRKLLSNTQSANSSPEIKHSIPDLGCQIWIRHEYLNTTIWTQSTDTLNIWLWISCLVYICWWSRSSIRNFDDGAVVYFSAQSVKYSVLWKYLARIIISLGTKTFVDFYDFVWFS